MQNLDDFPLT